MSFFNKRVISFPLPGPVGTTFHKNGQSYGRGLLSISDATFATTMKLPAIQVEEFLGVHFNLGTKLSYSINGISGEIKNCQYNFIYVPQTECEVTVQKGPYESLRIQIPTDYLKVLKELFPILDIMLKKVRLKEPSAVSSNHINCSAQIQQDLKYLSEANFAEQATEPAATMVSEIVRVKVSSLLIDCLSDLTNKANHFVSREAYRQKVEIARSYLLDHLKDKFSVERIAKKVGLEEHKLRKYFKAMYKCTMMDFLHDARLEKAKALLLDTDLSIERIGRAIGQKNLPHFSNSFRKKYGYSPREFRDKLWKGQDGEDSIAV
jgi:AraC-like DNA-binding protein/RNase P/RNase MRP subunit p29